MKFLDHGDQFLKLVKRGSPTKFSTAARCYDPAFFSSQNAGMVARGLLYY